VKTLRNNVLGIAAAFTVAAGCAPMDDEGEGGTHETTLAAVGSTNGLLAINGLLALNGLTAQNGLLAQNGFLAQNGLNTGASLPSTSGLMTSAAGRKTVEYLVRCALPANRSITRQDQYGQSHTFTGQLGMYPSWESGQCALQCQEYISSCLMAHINTTGTNIPIWLDSPNPAIGWGRNSAYPHQEGSFFGNIFVSPPRAYYCGGRGFSSGVVPGRIGAAQSGAPYVNPFGWSGALCTTQGQGFGTCVPADYPNSGDGFKACGGYNNVMTVWRQ
jgi:hypothetical protein